MQDATQQSISELKACTESAYSKPEYSLIAAHLSSPEMNYQPTMAQLADEKYPSKKEADLLIRYQDDIRACRQPALEKIGGVTPSIAQVLSESGIKGDAIVMQLAKRKITWGQAAEQKQDLLVITQKKILAANSQIEDRLNASHQAEMRERQRQFEASEQRRLMQQSINRADMPTTTNCTSYVANQINCQSY